jgi:hypothetical protein
MRKAVRTLAGEGPSDRTLFRLTTISSSALVRLRRFSQRLNSAVRPWMAASVLSYRIGTRPAYSLVRVYCSTGCLGFRSRQMSTAGQWRRCASSCPKNHTNPQCEFAHEVATVAGRKQFATAAGALSRERCPQCKR